MTNRRRQGNDKERLAADYLRSIGFEIVTANFYCRAGEIDIIAREGKYLCFIEVKYRSSAQNGYPLDAVDQRKARRISRSALVFLTMNGLGDDTPCRFDVVSILGDEVTLVRNAFDFEG